MSLTVGARLGSYEVLSAIGAGGMGEVYRARDTRLKRDVAIKVLPADFATDPDRLARFQREAELLASLNHPNIAAVYGLEEGPAEAGHYVRAIVLELIEGDTLAELIARGPLVLSAALAIARQVTEALEAAHEKGVIHRDLKPANIKVTPDGKVKVLDFGLAAVAQDPAQRNINATDSPTLTLATQAGLILGTAAYMSPEQATGAIADKRADVWAFGVVLWEMLTGTSLFAGDTVSHTLAYVITREPDWNALPANTPVSIRRLLRRCLEKDRKRRLPEIASARMEIDDALHGPPETTPIGAPITTAIGRQRRALPWALLATATTALLVVLGLWSPWKSPAQRRAVRLSTEIGADATLAIPAAPNANIAISPDGDLLAVVAQRSSGGTPQLFVRRLAQLVATPLAGTENATNPFFSPDGDWIAFFADGKLKKTSATGGGVVTLCDAPNGRGGTWASDGTIAFVPNSTADVVVMRVSSAGGQPEPLTTREGVETLHRSPQWLDGGKAILFTAAVSAGAFDDGSIVVQRLAGGTRKIVRRGGYYGRYLPSGHLIYMQRGTLFAAPFDLDRLEITGDPVPVLEGVMATGSGGVQLAVSANGTLVYVPGEAVSGEAPIAWMDRDGKTTPLRTMSANWGNPHFAPDGRQLAIDISNSANGADVWIYDWARDTPTRLTFDAASDVKPVWTPDGGRIVFSSQRGDKTTFNLYWQQADGTGEVQRLTDSKNSQFGGSWDPSGKFLAFFEQNPRSGQDIMILPVEGNETSGWKIGKPTVFLNTPFTEMEPMFSPDGRWIAYQSNAASGTTDVFVRPFPGPGGPHQISTGGGAFAAWSRSTPELLFVDFAGAQIMSARYTSTGNSFRADKPRPWSPGRFQPRPRLRPFAVHPDGQRVAVAPIDNRQLTVKQDKVVFIFNFFDELKRVAPAK
jgi:serine/threonine protein kinase/Tol biopolymer transport system component